MEEKQPLLLEESVIARESRKQGRRAVEDLVVVSLAYWLLYAAFVPTGMLQSSLNSESGLGVASLSVAPSVSIFTTLLAEKIIQTITPKWAIVYGIFSQIVYISANFYPTWWTMVPAAVVLGTGGGIHWVASGHAVTAIAKQYSQAKGADYNHITSLFQGLFFAGYALGGTTGGVIASLILHSSGELEAENSWNQTFLEKNLEQNGSQFSSMAIFANETLRTCGIEGCPWNFDPETIKAPKHIVQFLFAIFLAFDVFSMLLVATRLSRFPIDNGGTPTKVFGTIKSTLKGAVDFKLLLLLPWVTTGGVLNSFFSAEFPQVCYFMKKNNTNYLRH